MHKQTDAGEEIEKPLFMIALISNGQITCSHTRGKCAIARWYECMFREKECRIGMRGPEDLKHHILIHDRSMAFESAFPTWRTWLQAAGFPDINCERGLQINDSDAAYQAAINGSGVAMGRTTLVALDLRAGRLVRPFAGAVDCELAYYLIHSLKAGGDPGIAEFKNWVCAEATADRANVD